MNDRLRGRVESYAQYAGLLATAWVVWATSIDPYLHSRNLLDRIGWGIGLALCALGWSAIVGITLLLVTRHLNPEGAPPKVPVAAVVWFAPATILLLQFSVVGWAAGMALIVNATRLLCAGERPVTARSRHFHLALIISAGFQTAGVAFLMGRRVMAAFLLALSAGVMTATVIGLGVWQEGRQPNVPRSVMGLSLTVLLALMLNGVGGGFGWGLNWGGTGSSSADPATVPTPAGGASSTPAADRPVTAAASPDIPGSFPGVILWPEIKPVTTLIAPALAGGPGLSHPARPLTIPFGGEYWMYRWPFLKPPPNSRFQRGTPAALFFSTTDRFPLYMEAYHKLVQPIGTHCCRSLQLAILNADRYPGTVSLQVLLIDRESSAAPETLGVQPVISVPNLDVDRPPPVPETLEFHFPPSPRFEQFDEIKVVFHRTAIRISKSARVALERFVLVP